MIEALRAPAIAAHVALLASPSFVGRGLGARGLEATAEYVAAQLALAGIEPLGSAPLQPAPPGAVALPYFQTVPVREIAHPSGDLAIEIRRADRVEAHAFAAGVDVLLPELPPQALTAPAVFAGYGIREQVPARDDYQDLDVTGKWVIVLAGLPAGAEWQIPALKERYEAEGLRARYASKLQQAASPAAPTFFAPFEPDERAPLPLVRVSTRAADALLAAAGLTAVAARDARPRALPGASATLHLTGDERLVGPRNVIGVVKGGDAARSREAIVIGAHMDHLGRVGDVVYPGADDNASGTAALLEIARVVASGPPPSRTVVIGFWTGEEEGHFGSDYYVRHPAWPLERTVAYLNLDMIGHAWKPEEIARLVKDAGLEHGDDFLAAAMPNRFVELGVADWSADLPAILVRAARGTGIALHLDRTDGRNGGSDYRAFARREIPFVRFFGNYFDGYHEPIDRADTLDARQVLTMARVALASLWLLANP